MAVRSNILNPGVITKYVKGVKALKKSGDYDKFIGAHYKVLDEVHKSVLADASTVYSYDYYYGNSKPMVIKFWTGNSFMAGTNDEVTFTIEVRVDGVPGVLAIWSAYLDPKLCDHADPFETAQVDTFTIPNIGFKPWGLDKDLAGKLTPVCFSRVTIEKKPSAWDPRGDWHLLRFRLNSDGATWTNTVNKVLTEASRSVVVKLGPPKF